MTEENTTKETVESPKARKGKAHISVTVDPAAVAALREHCKLNKKSLSRGVEMAIQKYVESL